MSPWLLPCERRTARASGQREQAEAPHQGEGALKVSLHSHCFQPLAAQTRPKNENWSHNNDGRPFSIICVPSPRRPRCGTRGFPTSAKELSHRGTKGIGYSATPLWVTSWKAPSCHPSLVPPRGGRSVEVPSQKLVTANQNGSRHGHYGHRCDRHGDGVQRRRRVSRRCWWLLSLGAPPLSSW